MGAIKGFTKQIGIICAGCLALLCIAGCQNSKTGDTNETEATPSDVPYITQAVEEPTPSPSPELTEKQLTVDEMLGLIKEQIGENIIGAFYDDFDQNGYCEMFAFVESDFITGGELLFGEVVYVKHDADRVTRTGAGMYIYDESAVRDIFVENVHMFVVDEAYTSEVKSHVFDVVEDEPVQLLNDGYLWTDDEYIYLNSSAYDMCVDENGFSTGHTWKNYYFSFDKETNAFFEYGAIQITKNDFLGFSGADGVIKEIESKYPGSQMDFLYRENGIVNINLMIEDGTYTINKNFTAYIKENRVIKTEENEGRYLTALIPHIAVFPN